MLSGLGHEVTTEESAEGALERMLTATPDLLITDLNLPGKSGLELIADLRRRRIDTTTLVLTGHASIDSAIEATRSGVYDYLVKPVDQERLESAVRKSLERSSLRRELRMLRQELVRSGRLQELVGRSPLMLELFEMIDHVAPTDASVLVTGESGTGKELVARSVHRLSMRGDSRLVAINCAAIPENLLESEIFGHEKGAFTDATASRAGCFELADGGTLFLDEIGDMPVDLQSKLLRILEDGVVRRLGGGEERVVDVRVVAATNAPVDALLREGRLREDLYYRLNVFTLHIPPLRERRDDIPLLAEHFLAHFVEKSGKAIVGFSESAMLLLRNHDWPGNGRELRNAVHRAVILCAESEIRPHHLPDPVRGGFAPVSGADNGAAASAVTIPIGTAVRDAERSLILATLDACHGNRTHAAALLKITPKTLYAKLKRYESDDDSPESGQ
jgi:DNA-binding NtrC family response regulator